MNYRIDFLSSTAETFERIEAILAPVVKSLNLTFSVKGSHADVTNRVVRLNIVPNSDLEPAPLTPASGSAFDLMGSTVRHVFDGAIVAPSGMIGAPLPSQRRCRETADEFFFSTHSQHRHEALLAADGEHLQIGRAHV